MTNGSGPGSEVRALAPGSTRGAVLFLDGPLSLWGGLDPASGRVIDSRHPQLGAFAAGRIVVMPSGRGSSSSSSILAECVRAGTAPAAFVLREPDPILALGSLVGAELYGPQIPVIVVADPVHRSLRTGMIVHVEAAADRPARLEVVASTMPTVS